MFFIEIRLAVKLATQPFSNSILALAISGVSLITDTPLALTFFTLDCTTLKIASISCIIKSSTTGTSVPRGLNSASRWASINIGFSIMFLVAINAGLNRSTWPTCPFTLFSLAKAIISRASSTVLEIGFSMKTCFPDLMATLAHLK